MKNNHPFPLLLFIFFSCSFLPNTFAQNHSAQEGPLEVALFSPELIMQHQKEIKLTEEQRTFILENMQQSQNIFLAAEAKLQEKRDLVLAEIEQPAINEAKTLVLLEKVLSWENDIKKARLQFLIRLKNQLTPKQQKKLLKIKREK